MPGRKDLQPLKIGIDRLKIRVSVGIYSAEKKKKQDLFVTAELFFDDAPIHIDAMEKSVDYDVLCDEIKRVAALRHYELIENLALHIAQHLKITAKCKKAGVRIDKPLAADKNGAKTIFVVIEV
jgi:dihydroneopterin aldolase